MDDFRAWIEAQGFRTAPNSFAAPSNGARWYAWRRSKLAGTECEHNEGKGCQFVVYPHSFTDSCGVWLSVEAEVCGCAGGVWFKVQAYSLTVDEFKASADEIERALVAAWNAIPRPTE